MNGTLLLADSSSTYGSTKPVGTCFLRMDKQFLQCFHVYCTNCCNRLAVCRTEEPQLEEENEDGENNKKVLLQCATCQSRQTYPSSSSVSGGVKFNLYGLHNITMTGSLCEFEHRTLSCELLSVVTNEITVCSVKRTQQSLYEVSFRPNTRGEHRLCIRIDGEHVSGSPFPIVVRVPIETIGKPMVIIDSLERPWGVVVRHNRKIMVAEHDAHSILCCTLEGNKMFFVSKEDEGKVTFEDPRGIAVDHSGNLLVVDGKLCCVQKFTSEGNLIAKVGEKGTDELEFSSPVGIAVHPMSHKVYVTDNANHRIQVLNPDFTFCRVFGTGGFGEQELNFPWDVAFDSAGSVYVVDSWNHRIQVFTEDGKHLRQIGCKGRRNGELSWPSSICIDAEDFVYVTEAQNHRVSIFTSEGKFVTSFGRKGTSEGEFIEPTGIAVDRYGVVYVSDSGNKRLQVF